MKKNYRVVWWEFIDEHLGGDWEEGGVIGKTKEEAIAIARAKDKEPGIEHVYVLKSIEW